MSNNKSYKEAMDLLNRQKKISHSMLTFLQKRNLDESINEVLEEILIQSKGCRVYILEYSHERDAYDCTYEVTSKGVSKEINNLKNIKSSFVPWWHEQICKNKPIIFSSLDEMPTEAINERNLLEIQFIKSIMIFPLPSKHKIIGFMGIDIVTEEKKWSNLEIEWFSTMCNIIGICIELQKSESEAYKIVHSLEEREIMFNNIFSNSPMGYEIYDKNGSLIDINNKGMEIYGISNKNNLLGLNLFDSPNLSPEQINLLKEGQILNLEILYDFNKVDNYYRTTLSNTKKELIQKIAPVKRHSGVISDYILLTIDKTETKTIYGKIRDFENMFSIISRFAKIGYVKWNLTTKDGFAVKQWFDNWGESDDTPIDNIIGKYSKIHPDDRKPFDDFINNLSTSEIKNFKGDLRIKNDDGGWKWIHLTTIVSNSDPNNTEIIGLNFDITNIKETEQELIDAKNKAEAADKLKMSFLANMSHEIRTPLNALVGFTDLLVTNGDSFTNEEKKYYNSIIKENSDLLLRLINDILDLSKIEAGTIKIIYNDVEINALLNDIKIVFENKIKDEVKLIIELNNKECYIKTDKNRLYQVLTNLISNAIKFTNRGYIKLSYHINPTEILFTVEDTGDGIAKNELDNIFTNFVKLNNFSQGSGLGLAICKSLVKQMNGKIGVESTPGVGSKFWFTLPIVND